MICALNYLGYTVDMGNDGQVMDVYGQGMVKVWASDGWYNILFIHGDGQVMGKVFKQMG